MTKLPQLVLDSLVVFLVIAVIIRFYPFFSKKVKTGRSFESQHGTFDEYATVEGKINTEHGWWIVSLIHIAVIVLILKVHGFGTSKTEPNAEQLTNQTTIDSITTANIIVKAKEDSLTVDESIKAQEVVEKNTTTENTKATAIGIIKSYYEDLSHNANYDANNWFTPYVSKFISKTDVTPNEINGLHRSNTEFMGGVSIVDENTFKFNRNENVFDRINGYENKISFWQYETNFSCYRTSMKKYQTCKILVELGLDAESNKIASYKELQVTDLKFTSEETKTSSESKNEIKRNPDPRKDFANVYWNKNYTLFDMITDEPIFPIKKNGNLIYQIYHATNEDPRPIYGEFTIDELEQLTQYKFSNKLSCQKFCDSKNH